MEKQARAAVMAKFQGELEVRQYPLVEDLGPGEALVKVEMAGICGTDVHLWKGELPIPLPVILGHETVGVIVKVGEGLTKDWSGKALAVGDRVTWASSIVCGECFYCREKRVPTRCVARKAYGISYNCDEAPHFRGGYADWILLRKGTAILKLPDDVSTEAVVGAGCALNTAIQGIERIGLEAGESVVVQGAGPVGLAALAVALDHGAWPVVVVGGPEHRLARAREMGATATVSLEEFPTAEGRLAEIKRWAGPFGADLVVECVGHPKAVPEGLEIPRDGGRYLVLGQYANAGNVEFNPHTITRKHLDVKGSWAFEPRHVERAVRMLGRRDWGRLFAAQISHRFGLEDANEALMTVARLEAAKAVIVP
jgi:threonine dehydrogenase-like Zn-dependent dehydrogenase